MTNPQLTTLISRATGSKESAVATVLKLLQDGATIPFIARYRKEATGNLDEVQLAAIESELKKTEDLIKRKAYIIAAVQEQGQLTPALRAQLENCWDATELEDLYLPYKRKRKTRAETARLLGLEPLASRIWRQERGEPTEFAAAFLTKKVTSIEDALAGARDIIAEWVSEDPKARAMVRKHFNRSALISSKAARGKKKDADNYRDYLDHSEPLRKVPSHRLLAMLRGQAEGLLSVSIQPAEEEVLHELDRGFLRNNGPSSKEVQLAIHEGYQRLLGPSIETEFRNTAKEKADREAISIFAENLRQLLLGAPLGEKRVLGIDPGFRTGCKIVALDQHGNLLHHTTVYPHPPQNKTLESATILGELVKKYRLEAVAIGNGTAGRETYDFCRGVDFGSQPDLFLVNESGASIYSASEVAREEFPDQDLTVRGTISIARRLMDPLAELVKIDPKSIGVGQYQYDVNQVMLRDELNRTVASCVNSVGVDLNTASQHLLTHISGLGPSLAANIVEYRRQAKGFTSRAELKKVPRLGEKAFEQAAGFLRIRQAANPLDNTAVHPEQYPLVERMAKEGNFKVADLIASRANRDRIDLHRYVSPTVGLPTLLDIMEELAKPGRDPRGEAQTVSFGKVTDINDLKEGMLLPGVVTNVTAFGAFVDIGIKENGLVHVSQLADRFVSDPKTVVSLNQQVQVRVVAIDLARKRVGLSMKGG